MTTMRGQSMNRRNRTLTDYVDSLGHSLPNDYHKFQIGGEDQDNCLFCLASHNNSYKVYKMDAINIQKKEVDCYACADCGLAIDSMIRSAYSDEWLQMIGPKEKKFYQIDDVNSRYEQVRLSMLRGEYLPDVALYYTRHTPKKDEFIENNTHLKCYRCDEYCQGDEGFNWFKLETPVSPSVHIIGGEIRLCHSCCNQVAVDMDSVSNFEKEVYCSRCGFDYVITTEEYNNRKKGPDVPYLCPECAYTEIDSEYHDSFLMVGQNIAPRKSVMFRYKDHICSLCEKEFYLDLMISHVYLNRAHRSSNNYIHTLCHECSPFREFLNSYPYAIKFNEKTLIVFNIDKSVNEYFVYKLQSTGGINLLMSETLPTNSLSEAVCLAFSRTESMLYGKQGSLWKLN